MKFSTKLAFLALFTMLLSCTNDTDSVVKHHKSHEESRQNVPFSDAVQVGNLYFLTGQIGKDHKSKKIVEGGIEAETTQTIKNITAVLQ